MDVKMGVFSTQTRNHLWTLSEENPFQPMTFCCYRFALDKINRDDAPVRLNGVKLGGYVLDGCSSAKRSSTLINGLYSGALDLQNPREAVDVGEIKTWLTYSDDSTMTVARSLGLIGKIFINC